MNAKCAKPIKSLIILLGTSFVLSGPAQAADTFTEAFTKGQGKVAFRYRLEQVDQDVFDEDALASTLRARLNFKTDDWKGFGAFIEFDYVADIIADDYNAGAGNTPDKVEYPVVADPTGSDLNQAFLQWKNKAGSKVRGGRQRIILDNARFVGNVGWRQNEQTYDAAYFQHKSEKGLDIQFGHIWQVNRIFGDDVSAGEHDNKTWLANLANEWKDLGKLTLYYYDINNKDLSAFSTQTVGARFAGSTKLDKAKFAYVLEYAHQTDAHNNAVDYSADYFRADLSIALDAFTPYVGFESLGGDHSQGGASFRTPLATLHAFNGWADQFLATPDAGLNDWFGGVKGKLGVWDWNLLYHDFSAQSGGGNFASEIDASVARKFAEKYGVLFKMAYFDADQNSSYTDTKKLWLQLTAHF